MPMLRRLFLLPLFFVVSPCLAQVPAPPSSPIPAKVPDHSQESYVVEKLRTAYRFENDGTGRREISARIKIQSEAGGEEGGRRVTRHSSAHGKVGKPVVSGLQADRWNG